MPDDSGDLKAYRVLVHGRVTGVCFRYSAVQEAARFPGLQGYVRNKDSRTVECVVQGPEPDVNAMLIWLRHGPSYARVIEMDVAEIPVEENRQLFTVKYSL